MRKKRLKLGDIYEIALPNGLNAYGRLYKEYNLAFYRKQCENISQLPSEDDYVFIVGVYKDLLQDGEWKVVGNRPFMTEEEAWTPPKCIKDKLSGKFSLYIKGEVFPSTEKDCGELERVAVWDRHHIIDRLMGETKWNLT